MTREEQIRSFVDGELSELDAETLIAEAERDALLAAELAAATSLRGALAQLRAHDAPPPGDLVDRSVRRAVLERAREETAEAHTLTRLTRWFVRPRAFRARPAALMLAAVAGVVLALAAGRLGSRNGPRAAAPFTGASDTATPQAVPWRAADDAPAEVAVRFVLPAIGARSVVVAGDFNEWRTDASPLVDDDGDGVFVGTVSLARGTYDYMFVVDGERWVPDPYASQYRDDGFGQHNAVLRLD